MSTKLEIIKSTDIGDDMVVIVARKIRDMKHCKDCPYCKDVSDMDIKICSKYKAVVSPDDACIEVGM